jgi:hypothetical protein
MTDPCIKGNCDQPCVPRSIYCLKHRQKYEAARRREELQPPNGQCQRDGCNAKRHVWTSYYCREHGEARLFPTREGETTRAAELAALAESDGRSFVEELDWLIDQELARRESER